MTPRKCQRNRERAREREGYEGVAVTDGNERDLPRRKLRDRERSPGDWSS